MIRIKKEKRDKARNEHVKCFVGREFEILDRLVREGFRDDFSVNI